MKGAESLEKLKSRIRILALAFVRSLPWENIKIFSATVRSRVQLGDSYLPYRVVNGAPAVLN